MSSYRGGLQYMYTEADRRPLAQCCGAPALVQCPQRGMVSREEGTDYVTSGSAQPARPIGEGNLISSLVSLDLSSAGGKQKCPDGNLRRATFSRGRRGQPEVMAAEGKTLSNGDEDDVERYVAADCAIRSPERRVRAL